MVVRNIRGIGRPKPISVYHAIPPPSAADYDLEIVTSSTTINIKDEMVSGSFTDGVTNTIGTFECKILDPEKVISNQISKFDTVNLYGDYGASVTNKRFSGKIERSGYIDIYTTISGRSVGMILTGTHITYNTVSKQRSVVFQEILEENYPDVTDFSQIEEDTTEITVNYSEVPFQEVIEELCGDHHYFYLDYDLVPHYFTKGSRTNQTEAIIEDINHLQTEDNAEDTEGIATSVRVYGNKISNIPIIATSPIDTTNTQGVIKEVKLDDTSSVTAEQAMERANSEAINRLDAPQVGSTTSLFLPTLQPGEKLFLGIPREKIDPGHYNINQYTHIIDIEGDSAMSTNVVIEKHRLDLPRIIKQNIQFQSGISENDNPNKMDFSRVIQFNVDSGEHTNTQIIDGVLKTDGSTTGTWISNLIEVDSNVTAIESRISGSSIVGVQIFASLDGGVTFEQIGGPGTKSLSTIPTGRKIKLKVVINSNITQINAVGFLYSLST